MSTTYNPLVDPAADGYAKVDALADANTAPLASDDERQGFWLMLVLWLVGGVGVVAAGIAVGFAIHHFSDQYESHKKQVATIQTTPVALPHVAVAGNPVTHSKRTKFATNKIATQAINMPAIPSFEVIKPQKTAEPLTPAEQDFAKELATLESKL